MEEVQNLCPLVTQYATSDIYNVIERPFSALDEATLERLYLIRRWPIDVEKNPIPFKRPSTVRNFLWDVLKEQLTDEPFIIREFQKQAIHHLARMPRFILGDAVGLGKTPDVLVAFASLKAKNPSIKMVVITTKTTTFQWFDECHKYTTLRPKVMTDTYRGLNSSEARYQQMIHFFEGDEHDILIAKYDSLKGQRKKLENGKKEKVSEEILTFKEIFKKHRENTILTLDESHRFKSTGTQTRQLIVNICLYPERVWALTATVIKNNLDEFYAIATAIGIKPLGTVAEFRSEYCIWREQIVNRQGFKKRFIVGYQNVAFFKEQLRPFFFGRSQRQVNEPLPILSTVIHPVDLNAKQAKILIGLPQGKIELPPILFKVAGECFSKDRDYENEMTQLSVQQLVANHWALLDRNTESTFHTLSLSPKEEMLLDMLDGEYRGEKVIVFTKYRSWIDRLEWLTKNGHFTKRKFLRITGNENETQRNDNKRLFQSPDSEHDLIVMSSAGVEGVNLQQAAHMILLDVPWSWGDLIQLVGRMVRMASPHSACTLHIMAARGTIDEYTIEVLKGKKGVFEAILGDSHSAGILDSGGNFDIDSGMEQSGTEVEFKALLRAHCKKVGLKSFLKGDLVKHAQDDVEYRMSFEREPKKLKYNFDEDCSWLTD